MSKLVVQFWLMMMKASHSENNFYGELSLKIREANIQIQIYFYYKMCKIT